MPTHEIIYRRLENPYDEEKSAELASINPSGDYRGYSHKQYSGALARHKPFLQVWTPFDSIELERSAEACKSPAETTSYRESHDISIRLPLIGFTLAMLVGIAFLATGVGIAVASRQSYHSLANQQDTFVLRGFFSIMTSTSTTLPTEIIILCFSIVVTLCMEAIGFVHSMTLRSALAAESRLEFNTNLRLFTATKHQRWTSPNGIPANILMLLLLILSYASGTLALTPVSIEYATNNDDGTHTYIDQYYAYASAQPLIVLGTSILLQGIIVLSGLFKCQRLLRSTSVLDTTRALMYDYDLVAQAGRCMHPIGTTDIAFNPRKPSPLQPSVWSAHLAPKKVLLLAWCLVALYATWGGIILYLSNHAGEIQVPISGAVSCYLFGFGYELGFTGLGQWSFLPNTLSAAVGMVITIESGSIPVLFWLIIFVAFALLQGGLTFQLHLYEAIVNAVRDERAWRAASTKGATLSPNVLGTVLSNWPSVMLLVFKSLMHWMFGLSLNFNGDQIMYLTPDGTVMGGLAISFQLLSSSNQIWNMAVAFAIFTAIMTIIATRCPRGPQPAAYGHFQTLANLIDEWHPVMYWGHKVGGKPICHAGTSDRPLAPVLMDRLYAGQDSPGAATTKTPSDDKIKSD